MITTTTDRLAREMEGDFPSDIRLEPDQTRYFRFDSWDEGWTQYGVRQIMVLADEATGELGSFWVLDTVRISEVIRCLERRGEPQYGDRVGIWFGGKAEGKDYNLWRVRWTPQHVKTGKERFGVTDQAPTGVTTSADGDGDRNPFDADPPF